MAKKQVREEVLSMSPKQRAQLDRLIERVKQALARWHEAGVEVVLELQKIEQDSQQLYKLEGHSRFGDFIRAHFPNSGFGKERYDNVVEAIEAYGLELVRQVGPEAAHAMNHPSVVRHPERKSEMIRTVRDYVTVNHQVPNVDFILKERRRIAPETNTKAPRTTQVLTSLDQVRAERDELKRKLSASERKCAKLERENAELQEKIGSLQAKLAKAKKARPSGRAEARVN